MTGLGVLLFNLPCPCSQLTFKKDIADVKEIVALSYDCQKLADGSSLTA